MAKEDFVATVGEQADRLHRLILHRKSDKRFATSSVTGSVLWVRCSRLACAD